MGKLHSTRQWIFFRMVIIFVFISGMLLTPTRNVEAAPTTCQVTNNADSGSGSLRAAIADTTCAQIYFSGDYTITLQNTLSITRSVSINGTGHTIVLSGDRDGDGSGEIDIIDINAAVTVSLTHLTLTQSGTGEAIWNHFASSYLNLYDVIITDTIGNGIYNYGTLYVEDSTFQGNVITWSSGIMGAGIWTQGNATIRRSAFIYNHASGQGGGIVNYDGTMVIENTLFYGNSSASTTKGGGAIYNNGGTITGYNLTIYGNSATNSAGGIYINAGTVTLYNSIIANSTSGGNCNGPIAGSNNLVDDTTCNITGIPLASLHMGTLGYNGGATQTLPITAGSIAINAANAATCLSTDQRNVGRARNYCDVGSFELRETNPPAVSSFSAASPSDQTINISSFFGSDDVGIASFLITTTSTQPTTSTAGWTTSAPTVYTVASDATYTLYPWVMDTSGNVSAVYASPAVVVVDTTTPTVTISSVSPNPTSTGTSINWTVNENGTYTVRSGATGCSNGTLVATGAVASGASMNTTVNSSQLTEGANTIFVCVTDAGSNTGSASTTVNKDSTAPAVTITGSTPNPTNASVTVSWHADESGTYSIRNGGTDCSTGTLLSSNAYTASANVDSVIAAVDLAPGSNTIRVCVTDALNQTGSDTEVVVYDSSVPALSSITRYNPSTALTNASAVTFRVVFSEDVNQVDLTDFTLSLSGTVVGSLNSVTPVSASIYDVAVTGVDGDGTLSLGFSTNNIVDLAGNSLGNPGTGIGESYTLDNSSIEILSAGVTGYPGVINIQNGGTYYEKFSSILVAFNSDAFNPAGDTDADDVTNPANYVLLQTGADGFYNTEDCTSISTSDVHLPTGPVVYSNTDGQYIATITVNGGTGLPYGRYRLFICGSTSILDLSGNELNGGMDVAINFTLTEDPASIPSTGFAPNRLTVLPEQTVAYTHSDLWLEIPALGVQMDIVGVPQSNDGTWDVSWLGEDAGWLAGTAYPTWDGNSVITGHVWNADNTPGPFNGLGSMRYGQQIIIHANGAEYVYEVRGMDLVSPGSAASMLRHQDQPWVTLVTCVGYNESTDSYRYRVLVRAVLIEVR